MYPAAFSAPQSAHAAAASHMLTGCPAKSAHAADFAAFARASWLLLYDRISCLVADDVPFSVPLPGFPIFTVGLLIAPFMAFDTADAPVLTAAVTAEVTALVALAAVFTPVFTAFLALLMEMFTLGFA